MSNNLDEIVRCEIAISSPASDEASFNTILLVVPGPSGTVTEAAGGVIIITQAGDLKGFGFTEEDAAYKAASIAYSQNPSPYEIYVIIRKDEPVKGILDKALETNSWYGIHLTSFSDPEDINDAKEWAEANSKLFAFEYSDIDACPISGTEYYRTFGMYSENKLAALAWMAKCFGYDPGSETWALKSLSVIIPSQLSTNSKKKLEDINISCYLRYAGKNIINSGGGKVLAGEWIDVIRFRDWLKNSMQVRIFNLLATNEKIPYEDSGITAVEGQILAALAEGQEAGGIAKTAYDADGNAVPGYTVTVPLASSISDSQKATRKLTGCKFTARLAGAVQAVSISGSLAY